ncbi:MAG: hypothetical protein BGO53_08840 [Sphingobacteriales bacterium 39-19]|nr:hypothetical protein [Sphingobacteriales bacterium]OJW09920.1 MAG: hypothetical protein BGO53_08840 [Sphingobacteriales bacterium 39-19]
MTENILNRLKIKREELGMNVNELARLLHVKAHNIYKWEGGTRPVDGEVYKKLESFINGIYDPCIEKGIVNLQKLVDFESEQKQSFVKNAPRHLQTLSVENITAAAALEAQKQTIELLKKENERLLRELEDLKEKKTESSKA